MNGDDFEAALRATLGDQRLSTGEQQALSQRLAGASAQQLAEIRHLAFDMAQTEMGGDKRSRQVLGWLQDVISAAQSASQTAPEQERASAYFSPGEDPLHAINGALSAARKSADICVFTITDDRISQAIVSAHRRGVEVRIITDNDKAFDRGSDVDRLERHGIAVRVDRTDAHMHHKFAVLDKQTLLTGSYNWTRSACRDNYENVIISTAPALVTPFCATFEQLWQRLE